MIVFHGAARHLGAMQARPILLRTPLMRLAGVLWLLAGSFYLTCETIAAAGFPGYSYAHNYISDLGVPYDGMIHGRALHSSLAQLMNFGGFIVDGTFYGLATVAASWAIFRSGRGRAGAGFLMLGLIHAVGTILVGSVPNGPREVALGFAPIHLIGAAMSIIGGNAALLAAAGCSRRFGAPVAYRMTCVVLGLFGFASLALLEAGGLTGRAILPDGLLERGAVYPITAWEIMTGAAVLLGNRGKVLYRKLGSAAGLRNGKYFRK